MSQTSAKRQPIILGVETACDDCAIAIARGPEIIAHKVVTESLMHQKYGGIVPELAARQQLAFIDRLYLEVLEEAGIAPDDIDYVAVNNKHGLIRSVSVGVAFANGVAAGLGKPLISVHHVEAHLMSPEIGSDAVLEPSLCLAVAGGHNLLVDIEAFGKYRIIGRTLDDCAGEAFDKVAIELGLGFPGGPQIDALSKTGKRDAFPFPRPMIHEKGLNFSFSGLKTAVRFMVQKMTPEAVKTAQADLAASFQGAIVDVLVTKSRQALVQTGRKRMTVAGGVAANSELRDALAAMCADIGVVFQPAARTYCGDNAAMVAYAAGLLLQAGRAEMGFWDATPSAVLGEYRERY
ncbi:MAG: tRNA (adenosine(37)-N6)-threonylcarbamoyltransferase complex transferase subunit TsaD [Alphaproteobacteria bacterium]|nr:tRNA (adenosine(37)-N6)-threonylcarbamoyltransferase complex transferase subunit TsaD [Alphaproteobacteria bacterium]